MTAKTLVEQARMDGMWKKEWFGFAPNGATTYPYLKYSNIISKAENRKVFYLYLYF